MFFWNMVSGLFSPESNSVHALRACSTLYDKAQVGTAGSASKSAPGPDGRTDECSKGWEVQPHAKGCLAPAATTQQLLSKHV